MSTDAPTAADTVFLSVVIPAYNEESKIGGDLESLFAYLERRPCDAEALVVDDGSSDRTAEAARSRARPGRNIRVLVQDRNRGKGRAVKSGVLAARGKYVLVADAGGCVPFENLERGLALLGDGGNQAAFGSRAAAGAVLLRRASLSRRMGSRLFRLLVRAAMGVREVADTQCGFKIFEGAAAREIFCRSRIDGFMVDVEIVLLARKLGFRLAEFPVDWTCDPDTRFRSGRGSLRNIKDLVRLRLGL